MAIGEVSGPTVETYGGGPVCMYVNGAPAIYGNATNHFTTILSLVDRIARVQNARMGRFDLMTNEVDKLHSAIFVQHWGCGID